MHGREANHCFLCLISLPKFAFASSRVTLLSLLLAPLALIVAPADRRIQGSYRPAVNSAAGHGGARQSQKGMQAEPSPRLVVCPRIAALQNSPFQRPSCVAASKTRLNAQHRFVRVRRFHVPAGNWSTHTRIRHPHRVSWLFIPEVFELNGRIHFPLRPQSRGTLTTNFQSRRLPFCRRGNQTTRGLLKSDRVG